MNLNSIAWFSSTNLNFLCDSALHLFRHKILKHKTPSEGLCLCFVLLFLDEFPVDNKINTFLLC